MFRKFGRDVALHPTPGYGGGMSNTTNTNKKTKKTGLQWEHLVAGEWQREALTYGSGADAYYHDRCKSPDWRLLRIDPTGDETVVHHHGLIDDWNL